MRPTSWRETSKWTIQLIDYLYKIIFKPEFKYILAIFLDCACKIDIIYKYIQCIILHTYVYIHVYIYRPSYSTLYSSIWEQVLLPLFVIFPYPALCIETNLSTCLLSAVISSCREKSRFYRKWITFLSIVPESLHPHCGRAAVMKKIG